MPYYTFFTILTCMLWPASAVHMMCLSSPTMSLQAGYSVLSAVIDAPQSTRCQATVDFGALSFLPLHFDFSTTKCDGQLIATFTIPAEVPNGEADVMWKCAGFSPYCYRAIISNGTSDPNMQLEREAEVGCIVEEIGTRSLLVTQTWSTGATTRTALSVVTMTTTKYPKSQVFSAVSSATTMPLPVKMTSRAVEPTVTATDRGKLSTDTTGIGVWSAGSVPGEMPQQTVTRESATTTPPLAPMMDSVFSSVGSTVTKTFTKSVVATLLTTTLMQTVAVGCGTEAS